jgi:hypothetical protein
LKRRKEQLRYDRYENKIRKREERNRNKKRNKNKGSTS